MTYPTLCDFRRNKELLDTIDFYTITGDYYFIIENGRLLSIEETEDFLIIDGFKTFFGPTEILFQNNKKFKVFHYTDVVHLYIIKSDDPMVLRELYCEYKGISDTIYSFNKELTEFHKINKTDFYNGKYKWFIELMDRKYIHQKFEKSINIEISVDDIYKKIDNLADYKTLEFG